MKKTALALLGFFLLPLCIYAQSKTVTGVVKDEKAEVLEAVSVQNLTTKKIVLADKNGKFSIEAAPKDILQFTYTGYELHTETVGSKSVMAVTLNPIDVSLDAVIVSGYGIKTFKKDQTAATSKIDKASLETTAPVNISEVLKVRAAGVTFV